MHGFVFGTWPVTCVIISFHRNPCLCYLPKNFPTWLQKFHSFSCKKGWFFVVTEDCQLINQVKMWSIKLAYVSLHFSSQYHIYFYTNASWPSPMIYLICHVELNAALSDSRRIWHNYTIHTRTITSCIFSPSKFWYS